LKAKGISASALTLYVGAIVLANYLIVHGMPGATATPFHTYTLPVGFGLVAPAGVYVAAITFPLRDVVQRFGGRALGIAAILVAALLSWWISSPIIAVASGGTFLISETLDFGVYTPLQKRWFVPAVIASGVVAAVADSLIFLYWAGLPYGDGNLEGLIVGKLWIVTLVGGSLAFGLRRALPNRELVPA
jgi:queuosine precursor transporter